MRVIREGKKPPKKERITTCDRCDCEFAYERGDVYSDQWEGTWVYCPTCKRPVKVDYFPSY